MQAVIEKGSLPDLERTVGRTISTFLRLDFISRFAQDRVNIQTLPFSLLPSRNDRCNLKLFKEPHRQYFYTTVLLEHQGRTPAARVTSPPVELLALWSLDGCLKCFKP